MATIRPISELDAADDTVKRAKAEIRKAVPGVIQSFDPDTVTCVVELGIYSSKLVSTSDNYHDRATEEFEHYPLVVDAPVIFPRGGGCTLTFPVRPGDDCLVIFSDRGIDFWWQSGGTQQSTTRRTHDLSDAFVIPGPQSQPKKISNLSTTGAQLRTDDGSAFIEVATGGNITVTTQSSVTVNAPEIVLNGNVTINGNLSQGMGDGGGTATMNGPINVTNDVTADGKSLINHQHGGVETGSGNTGKPL